MPRTARDIIESDGRARIRSGETSRSRCLLRVEGTSTELWTLDLRDGSIIDGASSEAPDCVVTIAEPDFVDLFDGDLRPSVAFRTQKVLVRGRMRVALELAKQLIGRF